MRTISAGVCPLPHYDVNLNCLFLKKKEEERKEERRRNKGKHNQDSMCRNTMVTTPQSKLLAPLLLQKGVPAPSRALPEHCPETAL